MIERIKVLKRTQDDWYGSYKLSGWPRSGDMIEEIEVLKCTQDDWRGSYKLNGWYGGDENQMFVEVSFCGNISPPHSSPIWRTCVWGNDDLGMEFDCDNEAEAFTKFLQVIGLKFVNRKDLKALGFVSA